MIEYDLPVTDNQDDGSDAGDSDRKALSRSQAEAWRAFSIRAAQQGRPGQIEASVFADWIKRSTATAGVFESFAAGMEPLRLALEKIKVDISGNAKLVEALKTSIWLREAQRFNPNIERSIENRKLYSPSAAKLFHSPGYSGPNDYFAGTEVVVNSFDELSRGIGKLISKHPGLPLVWRGARNSDWGFHSSLYRILQQRNGVESPSKARTVQPYPTEEEMVEAEVELLARARSFWRFDEMSALEIFARVQHVGGPTRLIDVTRNPYIAAWFAVEEDDATKKVDARLFALATHPVSGPAGHAVELDEIGASRTPFWHSLAEEEDKQLFGWGAGSLRRLWFPPVYDNRILAQNAGFVFDGVPISIRASYFKKPDGQYFTKGDLLSAGSIYMKMYAHGRKVPTTGPGFSPSFSFRITSDAKGDIRETLESRFGYRASSIYPDAQGLSSFMNKQLLGKSFRP